MAKPTPKERLDIRFIDDEILNKYHYPWHIPRSFRNFIIHVYHGIKMERIYYAAKDLGELEIQITLMLENEFILKKRSQIW